MKRTDQKIGYVYKHIRLDTNEVFYVGVGGFSKREKIGTYTRAYCKTSRRNRWWLNIVAKTEYIVEIYKEFLTQKEAFEIEKELIKFYGRLDLGTGSLCNLTDGGEGANCGWNMKTKRVAWNKGMKFSGESNNFYGKKHTEESKEKNRQKHLGKKLSDEHKLKISKSVKGKGGKYIRTDEIKDKIREGLRRYREQKKLSNKND